MAAKKNTLWFGYLEAGEKGSAVVRDSTMDTGTTATIYLYNHHKGRILEYRREIVEPKLRDLNGDETALVKELRKSFDNVRSSFTPRVTVRPAPAPRKPDPEPEPEVPEFDDDIEQPVREDHDDGARGESDTEDDDD